MDVARFKKLPIMGILRGVSPDVIEPLVESICGAGLETIEITMNSADAPELIRKAVQVSGRRLMVGAGTVLNLQDLKSSLDAGATFVVMPVLAKEVLEYCLKHKIPAFPGALTAQEIWLAWQAGATMVKVFPAKFFGPEYFREIKGPFQQIKLLACAGVTPQNLKEYFACGADAVAVGASVFRKDWLERKDFKSIAARLKEYLDELP